MCRGLPPLLRQVPRNPLLDPHLLPRRIQVLLSSNTHRGPESTYLLRRPYPQVPL